MYVDEWILLVMSFVQFSYIKEDIFLSYVAISLI